LKTTFDQTDLQIEASTFDKALLTLPVRQQQFMQYEVPSDYQIHYKNVAVSRDHMFEKLYGAQTAEEKVALACRQMINYLAVTRSIADMSQNSFVINAKSPNTYYVTNEQTPELL
jgi:hypothetical protein